MADAPAAQDGAGDGGQDLSAHTQDGSNAALRKQRKLRKPSDVARCQVDNCGQDLSAGKLYLRRYSVCEAHFKAECVTLNEGRFRFCQQCNKFQALEQFLGNRRSCKARSEDRNLRRRKQRTDDRIAGVEAEQPPDAAAMGAYATAAGMAAGLPNGSGGSGRGSRGGAAGGGGGTDDGAQARAMVDNGGLALLAAAMGQQAVQGGHQMDLMAQAQAQANNAYANNALQLLAGGGRTAGINLTGAVGGMPVGDDGGASTNVLHQLQLAQFLKQATGGNGMTLTGLWGLQAQQLLQAAAAAQAQGGGNGGLVGGGMGDLSGLQDLSQLLLQQQLQQGSNPQAGGAPVLLLHNQNVMVVSLDQLGLLTGNPAVGGMGMGMAASNPASGSGGMGGVAAGTAVAAAGGDSATGDGSGGQPQTSNGNVSSGAAKPV